MYLPTGRDGLTRTVGEQALRDAERELAERERGEAGLPGAPLWTGVFHFLPDPSVITRLVIAGASVGIVLWMGFSVVELAHSKSPVAQFGGVALSIISLLLTVICFAYIAISCLTILQETAAGNDRIESWPESSLVEWLAESLAVLMAVFFSITPGMPVLWTSNWTGMPLSTCWLFVGISLYMFFPIVQLSILESSSLTTPVSQLILNSLRNESLLWFTFYMITFAIGLLVAITLTALRPETPMLLLIVVGIFWVFASFMYFRLLGRLAWACHVRHLQKKDETEPQTTPGEGRRGD